MRTPFIAGNWKMNMTHLEGLKFIRNWVMNIKIKIIAKSAYVLLL